MKKSALTVAAATAFFLTAILPASPSAFCQTRVKPTVVREYDHDVSSYTQGLFFHDGNLYESTGQYGKSTFRKVDITTGKPLFRLDFSKKYFVEGSVVLGDRLYVLTWTNNLAFIYDAGSLEYVKTLSYPREGWGLTTDGKHLIASDGSSRLYFLDRDLKLVRTVDVTIGGKGVRYLNELEWVDGKIWANVYTTDMIVEIDPSDGRVVRVIDCTGLLPEHLRKPSTDVLNGIARDPGNGKIYVTGKNWPKLYEIALPR